MCVLGLGYGCAPPLLAGVLGCMCVCVRAPLVPRHSWLGRAVCGLGVAWHLYLCRGSLRVVRAARVCGNRWPFLIGTCPCCLGCGRQRSCLVCLVALRWCAAPHPVRSLSVRRWALLTPFCLSPPRGLVSPDLLGGCAGHVEAGQEPGSLCLPVAAVEAAVMGSLCVVPVRGPAMGLSLAGPSVVGLGLRALRWFACVDPDRQTGDQSSVAGVALFAGVTATGVHYGLHTRT